MKYIISACLVFVFLTSGLIAQDYEASLIEYQKEMNESFKDPEDSPLTPKDRKKFKGLDFYPIDESYNVEAKFERAIDAVPFQMKTTTSRLPTYEVYGVVTFNLNGQEIKLNIYQNHKLRETEEYKNHLFLPFTDLTNGEETYGGGRYIDLEIPEGDVIWIDFNKAYNPYCAYNYNYSCPIPPPENDMKIEVRAGVRHKH